MQDSLVFQTQLWEALALLLGLGSTLKVSEPGNGFDPQRWRQLRDWLESRLDQPPGLEEMAAFVDLSPWHGAPPRALQAKKAPDNIF